MNIQHVLKKPLITEKATLLSKQNVYVFEIFPRARKSQVKKTVEELYGVTVGKVCVQFRAGKEKKSGRRMIAKKQAQRKIAFVHIIKGSIDIFPKT